MICKNCGHENSQDSAFCAKCGTQLEAEAAPVKQESVQQPIQQPVQQPVQQTYEPAPEVYAAPLTMATEPPKKKGKGKLILIIAIIVVLLAGIGVGGYFAYEYFTDNNNNDVVQPVADKGADEKDKEDEEKKKEEDEKEKKQKQTEDDKAAIEKLINDYVEGINDLDADVILGIMAPAEVIENSEMAEQAKASFEMLSGYTLECEAEILSIEPVEDAKVSRVEDAYNSFIGADFGDYEGDDFEVDGAYIVKMRVDMTMMGMEQTQEVEMYAVKIDGKWYLFEYEFDSLEDVATEE